ncbi:MAG TPA: QueG-associated DUF1730 domain-containing protein [Opitutaceae bacterium]|jgi:epoxyqueuosine reductase
MDERAEELRRGLQELGFDAVRFAAAGPVPAAGLTAWLDQGMHADMAWMDRSREKRLDLQRVLPGARSIIMLGVNYLGAEESPAGGPVWSRYSQYLDYHDTMKPGLEAAGALLERLYGVSGTDYRYYTDTGPILERGWAARSGVGFLGKNAMLISPEHGNWLLLGAILTRVDLPSDPPVRGPVSNPRVEALADGEPVGRLCGKCTRCLDACPTSAFAAPGRVDARRCIAYQTIENRGAIPRELRPGIGARVFGCDACLDVCPWNRFARAGRRVLLAARDGAAKLGWRELLELTPERFAALFKGMPPKRVKLAGLLRNACVGAGNSGDRTLIEPLARLLAHDSPVVRGHAVWALRRLGWAAAELAGARSRESDPLVLEEFDAEG